MTQTAAATTAQPNVSAIKEIELCSSNNKLITSSVSCSYCLSVLCNRTIQNNMWMSTCVVYGTCYCCCRCCCLTHIHRSYFWKNKKKRKNNLTTQSDDAIHYSFRIVSLENKSMIIISFVNILSWDLMKGNSPRHRFQNTILLSYFSSISKIEMCF